MNKGLKTGLIIGAVVVVLVMLFAGSYNGLIGKEEEVDSKLAQVSVQLERRADLIPNLVNTVKGYASHEQSVIDSVTDARSKLLSANSVEEKAEANQELTTSLNNLLVVVENYPDLKANTNFIQLQDELAGTENRIATARRDYNSAAKTYNTTIKKFPNSIIASMFNFEEVQYFEVSEEDTKVPNVEF